MPISKVSAVSSAKEIGAFPGGAALYRWLNPPLLNPSDQLTYVITCSLKRYCRLADAVVDEKSRSKRVLGMMRQPVCVGGGPAKGQSVLGVGGSGAVAGETLNMMA